MNKRFQTDAAKKGGEPDEAPSGNILSRLPVWTWKKWMRLGFVVAMALFAAEMFLRLTVPLEIVYGTFFTPGAHKPDPKYGFVFTPNYRGVMNHRDKVVAVPAVHDEGGFRPAAGDGGSAAPDTVVLLGGKSMAYCYGLPDRHTLAANMARSSWFPTRVYTCSWPGFDVYHMFHVYRDLVESKTASTRLVFLLLYGEILENYAALPDDFQTLPPPPSREDLFGGMDNCVLARRPMPSRLLGRYYYRSFLAARIASMADWAWHDVEDNYAGARHYMKASLALIGHGGRGDAADGEKAAGGGGPDKPAGARKFARFVEYLQDYFAIRNIEFVVALLPSSFPDAAGRSYSEIRGLLPPRVRVIDLHQELAAKLRPEDFIAEGHYGPGQAAVIGGRLAEEARAIFARKPERAGPQ